MANKKSIYILIILFGLLSCTDRKTVLSEKLITKSPEKFNLQSFNQNKKDSVYEYLAKDTIVRLFEEKDNYKKELITKNYSFKHTFVYSKNTNSLVNESCHFYGMPIGIWKSYDENGALINSKDYDAGFDFSIGDLITMLKKELGIDLINDNNYHSLSIEKVSYKRFYFINAHCYSLKIATESGNRFIKIDGTKGEILNDIENHTEE